MRGTNPILWQCEWEVKGEGLDLRTIRKLAGGRMGDGAGAFDSIGIGTNYPADFQPTPTVERTGAEYADGGRAAGHAEHE